jgi:sugar phosphate isomerase/epimerase
VNAPLARYVRLGLLHFMAYPVGSGTGPILETLEALLRDADFEVIEVSWMRDPGVRAEARALLDASGVEVKYGAHPRLLQGKLDLNALDESARRAAVLEVHEAIDEALELGAHEVSFLSGPYPGPAQEAEAVDALVRSIDELAARATPDGARLALEVFDRDVDKRCLVGPAALARQVAERVRERHESFGLVVDSSHTPLLFETPAQALEPVREFLVHAHIGNCVLEEGHRAYGDTHPRLGYPGGVNGPAEVAEFLGALFDVGYLDASGARRASISFEVKPVGDERPELVVAASKRVLADAWWRLEAPAVGGGARAGGSRAGGARPDAPRPDASATPRSGGTP